MVDLKVIFTSEVREDLRRLDKSVAQRILEKIKWLSQYSDIFRHKALTGDLADTFRLRVGDWRIFYTIDHSKDVLVIRLIKHRSKAYKGDF